MTSGDYLTELSQHWQQLTQPPRVSIADALHQRRRTQAYTVAEILLALVSIGLAYYFWSRGRGVLFNISGTVLFLSAANALFTNHRIRRPVLVWEDWSPQGIVAYRQQICATAIAKAHTVGWSCLVLLLFTLFVWGASRFEAIPMPVGFPTLYAALSLPTALALLAWARWRIGALSIEMESYARLLQEFNVATEAEAMAA